MRPKDAVDAVIQWFFENFDAEHRVSHDGREGYSFVWGPYDAREILEEHFSDLLREDMIRFAVDEIEHYGSNWLPTPSRLPQPDEGDRRPRSTEALHAEMLVQILELQNRLAEAEGALAGIGHNNPPESIADEPLSRADRRELAVVLTTLANQPAVPGDQGAAAIEASATLAAKRSKLRKWLSGLGPAIATAVASMTAEEAIKAIWVRVWPSIEHVLGTVAQWLASLPF